MENCARRLNGGESEETIMSAATSPSATADVTSNFYTALEKGISSSMDEVALGDRSGAGASMQPKSEYFSARVEEMMRSKSDFPSAVEHEIEHSKVHWSEVSGLSDSLEDDNVYEEVDRENEVVFREWMNDPQWKHHKHGEFFRKTSVLKLGQKISEGGQGEIFEVLEKDGTEIKLLMKVFKRGSRLLDLKKQWPCGILNREVFSIIFFGYLLDDRRFSFLMSRCWGDLRKLIDQAMQEKNNQGPPFPYEWSGQYVGMKALMRHIAGDMDRIHKLGLIHRDLKATNILLHVSDGVIRVIVADYECSIGVVGTGFWRALEILLALKNKIAIDFSPKVDVYSYGMVWYALRL